MIHLCITIVEFVCFVPSPGTDKLILILVYMGTMTLIHLKSLSHKLQLRSLSPELPDRQVSVKPGELHSVPY